MGPAAVAYEAACTDPGGRQGTPIRSELVKRTLAAVTALLVVALSCAAGRAAADTVRFGVNDDQGMFENGGGPFFSNLVDLGLHDNTITIRWAETTPDGFEDLGGGTTMHNVPPP